MKRLPWLGPHKKVGFPATHHERDLPSRPCSYLVTHPDTNRVQLCLTCNNIQVYTLRITVKAISCSKAVYASYTRGDPVLYTCDHLWHPLPLQYSLITSVCAVRFQFQEDDEKERRKHHEALLMSHGHFTCSSRKVISAYHFQSISISVLSCDDE